MKKIYKGVSGVLYKVMMHVFEQGVYAAQFINVVVSLGFFFAFNSNPTKLTNVDLYSGFAELNNSRWWYVFLLIAVLQAITFFWRTNRTKVIGGFALLFSSACYMFLSARFNVDEFLNTGITTYGGLAVVWFLCGVFMMLKYNLELIEKCD